MKKETLNVNKTFDTFFKAWTRWVAIIIQMTTNSQESYDFLIQNIDLWIVFMKSGNSAYRAYSKV